MADGNSKIAWHRVQLRKNRAALKRLEVARFAGSHDKIGDAQKTVDGLTRKIAESKNASRPMSGRPGVRSAPTSAVSPM